jgi:hypothetical protein
VHRSLAEVGHRILPSVDTVEWGRRILEAHVGKGTT